MEKTDKRKLSPEDQYKLRKQIGNLREDGKSNKEISDIVGYCYPHVSTILQTYKKSGPDSLKPKVRGRSIGEKRKLTAGQELKIINLLIDKSPSQMKLGFSLWSRDAIRMAIKQEFKIELPISTLRDYLKKWGYVPCKPYKINEGKSLKRIQRWLKAEYPEILARSKKEKAEIHWCDDTGRQNEADYGVRKAFLPHSIKMISTVTNRGKGHFMLYRESLTKNDFILFLTRLIKGAKRKILYLILFRHPVIDDKFVNTWLETRKKHIELFFLPGRTSLRASNQNNSAGYHR